MDKLTGKRGEGGVVGPRRRKSTRYDYAAPLTARCSSWPKFIELMTGNVSAGGLYVPTDREADLGERVEVDIGLPDGGSFRVEGKVVNVITSELAAKHGKPPGLGIQLDKLEGEAQKRFQQLLTAARSGVPVPEDTLDGEPVPALPAEVDAEVDAEPDVVEQADALPAPRPEPAMPPPAPGIKPAVTFEEAKPPPPAPSAPKAPRPVPRADDPVVGIDLGTTYTSIAAVVGKKVTMLPWDGGAKSVPTVVSFPEAMKVMVGAGARDRLATDPQHTVASPKRLLGRKYEDREIQGFLGQAPYRTLSGPDGSVVVEIWGQQYAVTQLCSYMLEEARRTAEHELATAVRRCVLTVPVSFDEARVKILRRAAEMAQLEVVALIDEPSAAALANRFDPGFGGLVGVYDFGGGTFDFSVVDVSGGDFQVMATAGDTWLGGDDFDSVLAEAAANQFWRMHKVDLRKQAVEWQKLVFACERAKRGLSLEDTSAIVVPEVLRTADGLVDLNISIDRATFERACSPIVERSLATCDEALALLGMAPSELSTVYLSGGTTYIPTVRQALADHFGVPVRTGVPPEHAVCLGAAIHAAQIQFKARTTLDARED